MGGASSKLFSIPVVAPGDAYLLFRCWTLPRHLKRPLTMMAMRVHKASHSSMLLRDEEENGSLPPSLHWKSHPIHLHQLIISFFFNASTLTPELLSLISIKAGARLRREARLFPLFEEWSN